MSSKYSRGAVNMLRPPVCNEPPPPPPPPTPPPPTHEAGYFLSVGGVCSNPAGQWGVVIQEKKLVYNAAVPRWEWTAQIGEVWTVPGQVFATFVGRSKDPADLVYKTRMRVQVSSDVGQPGTPKTIFDQYDPLDSPIPRTLGPYEVDYRVAGFVWVGQVVWTYYPAT